MSTTQRMFSLPAPCRGDSFTFEISVVSWWTGQGLRSNVQRAIEQAEPMHLENMEKLLRQLSREFEPDEFAAAEHRMNEELESPITYQSGLLSCRSWVRVGPDDVLCKHVQKQWTESSDDEANHVRAKRHIERLTELCELWKDFLEQVDEPLAAQAVRLADAPGLVGDIASEMTEKRQRAIQDLREIVDQAVDEHKKWEVYDFVNSYDSALRHLIQYLEIPAMSENGAGSGDRMGGMISARVS